MSDDINSIHISITPGEHVQNWLAARGIGDRVQQRDLHHPEPPAGLWSLLNGGVAIACLTAFVGLIGFVVFSVIPALAGVGSVRY